MRDKPKTPPAPLIRGGARTSEAGGSPTTPSPDKGRVGEGLAVQPKFLPYDKHLSTLARQNRQTPTPAETLLWHKVLRSKQFDHHKFLRQKPIGSYIVDFYCAELQLVIEIDGDSHAAQVDYDAQRTLYLNSLGLQVLRFANREVLDNLPGVYDTLSTFLPSQEYEQ